MAECRMFLAIWFALKLNVGCLSKDGYICVHDDISGIEVVFKGQHFNAV